MCVCTPSYYARAIKTMNESVNPELYVIFSDDIQWCKENIREMVGNREVVFVDWNKGEQSFRDIQLMTLCKHNIIANSSFSWWGAWLNNHENKVVMAPEVWMNKPLVNDPIVILIIDALRKLNQDKITIVFVGNGPEEEMLRQKAAGNNNIFFAGLTKTPIKYLQSADVLVSSSLAEGLPNTVLEALSCGLPCILSDIDPHKELIEGTEAGVIFNRNSVDELCGRFIDSYQWDMRKKSQEARKIAVENFGVRSLAEKYERIYEKVLTK